MQDVGLKAGDRVGDRRLDAAQSQEIAARDNLVEIKPQEVEFVEPLRSRRVRTPTSRDNQDVMATPAQSLQQVKRKNFDAADGA